MSKPTLEPPSLNDVDTEQPTPRETKPAATPAKKKAKERCEVVLTVPVGELPSGYRTRHLNVQLDTKRAQTLARVQRRLNADNARLADGKHVTSVADVVRWLLDEVAKAS